MHKNKTDIYLYRPVSDNTREALTLYESAPQEFPRSNILMRAMFKASIINGAESSIRVGYIDESADKTPLHDVIHPTPDTTSQKLELPAEDLVFFESSLGKSVLAITLDDKDGIINQERDEYMRRMGKTHSKIYIPHISLFSIDSLGATNDVLEWAKQFAPDVIELEPMAAIPSLPEPPKPNVKKIHSKTVSDLSTVELRDITNKPAIPTQFLQSLQKKTTPNNVV